MEETLLSIFLPENIQYLNMRHEALLVNVILKKKYLLVQTITFFQTLQATFSLTICIPKVLLLGT